MIAFLIAWMSASAENVTEQQALKIAQQFLKGKTFSLAESRPLTRGGSPRADADLYVFNAEEGGYVVVAGDDHCQPVLGYSDRSRLDMDNLPDNLKAWLDGYAEQIAYLKEHPEAAATRALSDAQPVLPLLGETEWGQDSPYNDLCPMDGKYHSVTGCVATAMAQVMYYHKWPAQTTKEIPGYTTSAKKIVVPSVPVKTINWNDMLPSYYAPEISDKSKQAVAELMQMCGTALEMNYTSNSSSAPSQSIVSSLREYFDYDESVCLVSRSNYHHKDWNQLMYDELKNLRPICYAGFTKVNKGAGHQFVIDGYDKDDYFHVNWGWGGAWNGYFLLDILSYGSVSDYEKKYAIGGYNFYQSAVIGIQKNRGEVQSPQRLTTLQISVQSLSDGDDIHRSSQDENVSIDLLYGLYYPSNQDYPFEYCIALFDEAGNLAQILLEKEIRGSGRYYITSTFAFGAGLADGTYNMVLMSRKKGDSEWLVNEGSDSQFVKVTISGNTIQLKSPETQKEIISLSGVFQPTGTVELHGQALVTITVTNNGTDYCGTVSFMEDGAEIGGRMIDIAAGETQDIIFLFNADEVGEKTLGLALYTYNEAVSANEYVPFATGTITVTSANGAYLRMKPFVQNETDGVVREDVVKVNVPTTNYGNRLYDDNVRCLLYKINDDNTLSDYKYADKHLKLDLMATNNNFAFELEGIEEGDYKLQMMFWRNGIWVAPATSNVYVTVSKEGGDGIITFADPIVESLCLYYWDANGDGRLTRSEAAAVETLGDIFSLDPNREKSWQGDGTSYDNLEHGNFKSFDELQYFTGLTSIDDGTFYGQLMLQSVSLPASIKSIGKNAFYYCTNLQSIVIPNSVETIGDWAFMLCKSVADVSLGSSLKSIGDGAFASCSSFQEVVIPEGCTTIGRMAFFNCESLTSVTVPATVSGIGSYAFAYTASPLSIHIFDLDAWLRIHVICDEEVDSPDEDGIVDGGGETSYRLYLDGQEVTEVVIPQSVTAVGNLLQGCASMTSLTIPDEVKSIELCAFTGCRSLEKVISYIMDPYDIEDVTFEYLDGSTGGYVFTSATLYVPEGTVALYQNRWGWKRFWNIVEIGGGSSVSGIAADGQPFDVHSLSGVLVRKQTRSLKALPKGVYIVKGRKVVMK